MYIIRIWWKITKFVIFVVLDGLINLPCLRIRFVGDEDSEILVFRWIWDCVYKGDLVLSCFHILNWSFCSGLIKIDIFVKIANFDHFCSFWAKFDVLSVLERSLTQLNHRQKLRGCDENENFVKIDNFCNFLTILNNFDQIWSILRNWVPWILDVFIY